MRVELQGTTVKEDSEMSHIDRWYNRHGATYMNDGLLGSIPACTLNGKLPRLGIVRFGVHEQRDFDIRSQGEWVAEGQSSKIESRFWVRKALSASDSTHGLVANSMSADNLLETAAVGIDDEAV
ncbi:uncharacterized protein PgNI_00024 [Pyricularia grisea]|uniref:Uncharacterized protein n=1 Tax=Pyricularia grisea TaxID=148305 RepID=A0A6P8BL93_PYRGI|nr:uncharacterized protein PgNI_00024 [Pyricularia grisea]TLD17435.1 hypothetical protein PgNI_00024 [Pyricularia grisea]